jgi:hypothetical protein
MNSIHIRVPMFRTFKSDLEESVCGDQLKTFFAPVWVKGFAGASAGQKRASTAGGGRLRRAQ